MSILHFSYSEHWQFQDESSFGKVLVKNSTLPKNTKLAAPLRKSLLNQTRSFVALFAPPSPLEQFKKKLRYLVPKGFVK